jgi:hypothetical protein
MPKRKEEDRDPYHPTHKLSDDARNTFYGQRKIEHIYIQKNRPQIPRPKGTLKPRLLELWIEQDRQIVAAGGWTAKDYKSIPGKDGYPGLGAMVHESQDEDNRDEDIQDAGEKQDDNETDQEHDDDAQGDKDNVVGDEHEQYQDDDRDDEELDEDDDLVEKLIQSYDISSIKMPTKAAMKAGLKEWGKWKPDGLRNQGDIFRAKWLPELLRRRAEAEAAEIRARKASDSTDAMESERDRTEDRRVDRTAKRKQAARATTTSVTQKQKSSDTDESRPRKRRKSAETYGMPDAAENNAHPERGVSWQDEMQMYGVYRDISKPSKRVTFQFPTRMEEVSRMFGASSEQISYNSSQKSSRPGAARAGSSAADVIADTPHTQPAAESGPAFTTAETTAATPLNPVPGVTVAAPDGTSTATQNNEVGQVDATDPDPDPFVPSAQGRLNKTRHEHVPSLYRDPKVANAWPVKNSTIEFMTIPYRFAKKMKPDNLSMAELIVWV